MIDNRCPNIDLYRRMIDNQLSPGEFEPLESHLEHCTACQQQLDELTAFADTAWLTTSPRKPMLKIVPWIEGIDIQEEVGRGGYGVVYRGYQTALARSVAIKVLRNGTVSTEHERNRFLEEAKTIAQLRHPNIAQVYAVDEDSAGNPYLLLEFIGGISLAKRLSEGPLPLSDAVRLVQIIAKAVGHAHEQQVIHRDLKPGNILLERGTFDRPVVTDFGLAKRLDAPVGLTNTVESLGTPSYMSPELAAGGAKAAGPTADVYSLGTILYECLTGHPPFRGATSFETLLMVRDFEPVPLRSIIPSIDRDLETVCLKCLEKSPGDRYPTAAALAEDLQRIVEHRPIQARPVTVLRRITKWRRRHPMRAASIGVSLLGLLALGIAIVWHTNRLSQERNLLKASDLVAALQTAESHHVPGIIRDLQPYRDQAYPLLQDVLKAEPPDSRERLHAAIALVERDPAQVEYLFTRLLDCRPSEVAVIADALQGASATLADRCWQIARDPHEMPHRRVRCTCTRVRWFGADDRLKALSAFLANYLATENPLHLAEWVMLLGPVLSNLGSQLVDLASDPKRPEPERLQAVAVLASIGGAGVSVANAACDCDPRAFMILFPLLKANPGESVPALRAVLQDKPADNAREHERVRLARRHAMAAIALTKLNDPGPMWSLLDHSSDPTVRSFLLTRIGSCEIDPLILTAKLHGGTPKATCRAIVLALGAYSTDRVSQLLRESLARNLILSYKNDPDAGYHSAIDWLLREKWGFATELDRVDSELAGKPSTKKRWFIDGHGNTFSVFGGPFVSVCGSPEDEPHRNSLNEARVEVRVPRTFAIATREVTVEQFMKFRRFYDRDAKNLLSELAPTDTCPVSAISPLEAMRYCRWLSKQENLPDDAIPYPELNPQAVGVELAKDYLSRSGYRLPTEAEWEFAARAGSSAARSYGRGTELIDRFAWSLIDSEERLHPVGHKLPNDAGLFDTLGNVWELCHPTHSPDGSTTFTDDGRGAGLTPVGPEAFFARGGSFLYLGMFARSAVRYPRPPATKDKTVGFRLARTIHVHPSNMLAKPK
jgi:serine/threonine protein kinase/formylglycine-generating enzyme required for sulfatase activity